VWAEWRSSRLEATLEGALLEGATLEGAALEGAKRTAAAEVAAATTAAGSDCSSRRQLRMEDCELSPSRGFWSSGRARTYFSLGKVLIPQGFPPEGFLNPAT